MIKSSPLLDIKLGITELNNVSDIYVVSIKNECKELLFILDKNYKEEPRIHAIELAKEQFVHFSFSYNEEAASNITYSNPQNFLYEPSASILKAGAFKKVAEQYRVSKLHKSSHLYTSENIIEDFPGKKFQIEKTYPYHGLRSDIKNLAKKANIITRNFPSKPEELHKKFKINKGGEKFLFFTTNRESELIIVECKKVTE